MKYKIVAILFIVLFNLNASIDYKKIFSLGTVRSFAINVFEKVKIKMSDWYGQHKKPIFLTAAIASLGIGGYGVYKDYQNRSQQHNSNPLIDKQENKKYDSDKNSKKIVGNTVLLSSSDITFIEENNIKDSDSSEILLQDSTVVSMSIDFKPIEFIKNEALKEASGEDFLEILLGMAGVSKLLFFIYTLYNKTYTVSENNIATFDFYLNSIKMIEEKIKQKIDLIKTNKQVSKNQSLQQLIGLLSKYYMYYKDNTFGKIILLKEYYKNALENSKKNSVSWNEIQENGNTNKYISFLEVLKQGKPIQRAIYNIYQYKKDNSEKIINRNESNFAIPNNNDLSMKELFKKINDDLNERKVNNKLSL